jgi:moderate conductance mechanosensitive channel
MWNEAVRIATIVLIAVGARLLLDLIAWTNRKLIERSFGAFLARSAKALTLNKLTISILRYAVYLAALGLILREFGVSLTAYLAGASIIGFAVAFGFQGLIQDLISGVFIILEDQFAVGDMVEISGQTGRVEEIGLRITKFRNYVGELIVVPNRGLANVGIFPLGCVIATVEVPLEGPVPNEGLALAREEALALRSRYPLAVLTEPEVEIVKDLGGGPHAQVRLSIWPGEKWVVERAFVPRLLGRLAGLNGEGKAIDAGRVVVHYGGKG